MSNDSGKLILVVDDRNASRNALINAALLANLYLLQGFGDPIGNDPEPTLTLEAFQFITESKEKKAKKILSPRSERNYWRTKVRLALSQAKARKNILRH